ncbi:MAG: DJ-1/PfpI family protein [Deltaproteobacteria bacterium]|jgi:4-methyl-5(b-hydroxyethyl)-thiazole monophosphate biosynthesis|nr:DJ-1/PfpI family protein [Deltaproteobacteria bacterium]
MAKAALFIISGFEETEAVTTADLLRRGKVDLDIVSLDPSIQVKGSHGIEIKADRLFADADTSSYDMLVIPGGTIAYLDHKPFMEAVDRAAKAGKRLAAICAAPSVLGALGIVKGKKAACYPGFEGRLPGADIVSDPVVTDGLVTTSRGPSTAALFGLELLRILQGDKVSTKVKGDILLA